MPKLNLDYNFAMKFNIDCGITSEDLEKMTAKAQSGLSRLKEMMDTDKVGFAGLPYQDLSQIKAMAKDLYRQYNDLVVIGIGGSALGLETIVNAILPFGYNGMSFTERNSFPRLWLLDNVDPTLINSVFKNCQQEDTFVIVISKSGSTVETAANFAMVCDWLQSKVVDLKKHIAVITDPEKGPLRDFANEKGLRSLSVNSNVGGRFSVLTSVGLLPAAILGVDIDNLLKGAASIVESDWKQIITLSAIYMHYMEHNRPINVLMPYSSRLIKFAEWFCQLWGESLGKKVDNTGKDVFFGSTPVRTCGAVDQHSQIQLYREGPDDKLITFIGVECHTGDTTIKTDIHKSFDYLNGGKLGALLNAELEATEAALLLSKRPSIRINIPQVDEFTLGQLLMLYQYVVPVIGLANNINPFDQPGVEEGKDFAYGLLGKEGYSAKKKEFQGLYAKQQQFII